MLMYGYQWLCMGLSMVMYGYQWLCMVINGYVWLCMVMYGYVKVIQRGGGIYGIYYTEGRRPKVDKAIETNTRVV